MFAPTHPALPLAILLTALPTFVLDVSPAAPVAGQVMDVTASGAPSWPVTIEIRIDGILVHSDRLDDATDTVTYTPPAANSGDTWEVKAISGGDSKSKSGVLL